MRIKKLLILPFVFGVFFIGCDLVYVNENINENEINIKEESPDGGIFKTLVEDEWTYGNFSKDGQIDTYYISVIKGMRYFIFTLNRGADTGLKISHSDGTTICDNYNDAKNLLENPYEFTATSTGTVTVTVASYDSGNWERGTGQYVIKYSSRQEDDVLLSEGVWKDDRIIVKGQTNKHHIKVTAGTRYFIWLNGSDFSADKDGDGTKTADANLKISYNDGTVIHDQYNLGWLYKNPYTFTASSSGTVIVTVAAYGYANGSNNGSWGAGTGTYAIKYTSRPEYDVLSEGQWKDDELITTHDQTNKYSINVIVGTVYSIYMNNKDAGDGTKTAKTSLEISHSDGTIICSEKKRLYSSPYSFTASSTGTVTITVAAYDHLFGEGTTGTYAIKYISQTTERETLSEGVWKDDEIIAKGQTNRYSMNVIAGTLYSIYVNDRYDDNETKTAYTGLKISHSDGTAICNDYDNAYRLYSTPYSFIASSTDTVTITVAARIGGEYYSRWEEGTGTYAIKYISRMLKDYILSEGVWKDDEIIADGQTNRYSINVIKGKQYFIYMNNKYSGDGTKTAYTGLKISHSDGTITNDDYVAATIYEKPYTFTASSTGTVTITVASLWNYWEHGTGTYAIKYTTK